MDPIAMVVYRNEKTRGVDPTDGHSNPTKFAPSTPTWESEMGLSEGL